MKAKFAALILCTALITASWLGLNKPAQALTLSGPQLTWFSSNQSIMNALSRLLGIVPTTTPGTGTTTTPPSTGNTNTGGSATPGSGTTVPPADNNTNPSGGSSGSDTGTTTPPATGNNDSGSTGSTTPPATGTNTGSSQTGTTTPLTTAEKNYQKYMSAYQAQEVPIVDAFRNNYDGSQAQALVGRAIWYMEYGYMVYGHQKYWDTGYIDCSNFVSLVYKDFGYSITSAARKYTTVGKKVEGVSSKKLANGKYSLVGVDKLRPGDIFLYYATDANGLYISHVALYMGVINGKPAIINTAKEHPTAIGIINGFSYWYGEKLYEVRRVLPDSAFVSNSNVKLSSPVIPAKYQLKPQNPIIMPKDLAQGF